MSEVRPNHTAPHKVRASAQRVVIERVPGSIGYVISDEDGEFARSTTIADALHYASDLLHGPGTGPRGSVWNLMRAMEDWRKDHA